MTSDTDIPTITAPTAALPAAQINPSLFEGNLDRTPPHDAAAERALLGSMLLSKDAIAEATEILAVGDFYRPAHATVYAAILDLYGRGDTADPVTVSSHLLATGDLMRIGGAPYLHTLMQEVGVTASAPVYARIIAEHSALRRLGEASVKLAQLAYNRTEGRDVAQILDQAQQVVYDVAERRTRDEYSILSELLQPALNEIETVGDRGGFMAGLPTGFIDLDKLTGGLHPGQLVLVAARPGLGKSCLLMDACRTAAIHHNEPAAMFSLEMSKQEITMRLLSAEARVHLHRLRTGGLNDEDWAKLARTIGQVSEAPLFIDDSPNMTLMEIRAKARRIKQRHGLRLICVDYLQLMSGTQRSESRQQEVSALSRGLKLLAKELEVPVIAASQLNRGPEQRTDKRPQLSDLRESGSLEQDADVVILLHRDDYYDKETARAGEADFIVAKHRNGPTDTITVAFQGHYSRFVDMSPEATR